MVRIFRCRFCDCRSDNRKSKIHNQKWAGLFAIAVAFGFGGAVAQAQPAGKVAQVGYAAPTGTNTSNAGFLSLRQGLRDLGYIDGKNILFEYRGAEGKRDL